MAAPAAAAGQTGAERLLEAGEIALRDFVPAAVALALALGFFLLVRWLLARRVAQRPSFQDTAQLATAGLAFVLVALVVVAFPMESDTRGQVLGLIGIVVSATIALSSTTFLGNAMAGALLRGTRGFRPGDFVACGEHFGRVTDMGLFRVELQTEQRDLTTLSNTYLVTHPFTVMRASGTVVSAEVSLGYDVPRVQAESALLEAATAAGLADPFVEIRDLGDFSVVYRASGLLRRVDRLLSVRAELRRRMLDRLHGAGVEIVSPTFMNTRAFSPSRRFVPEGLATPDEPNGVRPEQVVFDKADEAATIEKLRESAAELRTRIAEAKEGCERASDPDEKAGLTRELERMEARLALLQQLLARREAELSEQR